MMKLKNKILYIIIFIIFSAFQSFADNVSISADVDRYVYKNKNFYVTYTVKNAEIKTFTPAQIKGAKYLYGPEFSGSGSETQIYNGNVTQNTVKYYTVTYNAEDLGVTSVPPVTINVNNKKYESKPVKFEIVEPTSQNSGRSNFDPFDPFSMFDEMDSFDSGTQVTRPPKPTSKDIFIRTVLSKNSAYEQEPVICTIKLYTRLQIKSFIALELPTFNGFISERLKVSSSNIDSEKINGITYGVFEIDKYILFPQKSGTLKINPAKFDLTVVQTQQANSRISGFASFIPFNTDIKLETKEAKLKVNKLPEPKPNSFNGAVGSFTINSSPISKPLKTYEAAEYKITISGEGNLKSIKAPTVNFPSGFEVYDPQTNLNVTTSSNNITGSMECKYTFVPQYKGNYTIPETEFSYFDINKKKYEIIKTPAINVTVAKGNNTNNTVKNGNEDVKNKDIITIQRNKIDLSKNRSFIVSSPLYWIWYIIPIIALSIILFIYRKTLKERADIKMMKTKRASKVAKKRLKNAARFMLSHNNSEFYNELLTAMWGYISDKLQIPVSELNKENIANELEKYGIEENVITNLINLLDDCEFAQYAPEQTDSQINTLYQSASEIINNIENSKRKANK